MRLLVDTHVLLWFLAGDPQLSKTSRAVVEDSANDLLVSAGSLWEMAIKVSLGKLTFRVITVRSLPRSFKRTISRSLGSRWLMSSG